MRTLQDWNVAPAVMSGEVRGPFDEPCKRYAEGLRNVMKAEELQAFLSQWPFLAADAIEQAKDFTDADVQELQRSRFLRNPEKVAAADAKFGCILMPERMITLTVKAIELKVSEGLIYLRLWETGEHERWMELLPEEPCEVEVHGE